APCGLGAEEVALQVRIEHLPVLLERELEDRLADVDARVVDEDVDPPVIGNRLLEERVAARLVRDVGADGARLPSEGGNLSGDFVDFGGGPAAHDDVGARGREANGNDPAKPAPGAGDDGGASGQVEETGAKQLRTFHQAQSTRAPSCSE